MVIAKTGFSPDQYEKGTLVYETSFSNIYNAFTRILSSSIQFNLRLCNTFAESYIIYLNTVSEYGKSWSNIYELEKIL